MNKKLLVPIIITFVVAGGIGFFAGKSVHTSGVVNQNASGMMRGGGSFGAGGTRGARTGGGFVTGQVISKDATSITVQLNSPGQSTTNADGTTSASAGGSKLVIVSGTTQVMKTVGGTLNDLAVGTNVVVTGTPNSDGSVTATSVQIRPAQTKQ